MLVCPMWRADTGTLAPACMHPRAHSSIAPSRMLTCSNDCGCEVTRNEGVGKAASIGLQTRKIWHWVRQKEARRDLFNERVRVAKTLRRAGD